MKPKSTYDYIIYFLGFVTYNALILGLLGYPIYAFVKANLETQHLVMLGIGGSLLILETAEYR